MEKIAKYKVTTFCAPPTIYRYLIGRISISTTSYPSSIGSQHEAINPPYIRLSWKTASSYTKIGQTELVVTTATLLHGSNQNQAQCKSLRQIQHRIV